MKMKIALALLTISVTSNMLLFSEDHVPTTQITLDDNSTSIQLAYND